MSETSNEAAPGGEAALSAAIPMALHRGEDECPWVDIGDGSLLKLVQIKRSEGLWVIKNRFAPGTVVQRHKHTGQVFAFTLSGAWKYAEYPEINTAGSFLFEPAGSIHTLVVPETNTEPTDVWFAIWGANLNLGPNDEVESVYDAELIYAAYTAMVEAEGKTADVLVLD